MPRIAAALVIVFIAFDHSEAAGAQIEQMPSPGMGSYRTPTQRAAESYSRGAKAKRKAEQAKDPREQRKLYERAKEELIRSLGYAPNFNALLALGEVHLALGDRKNAAWACVQAQALDSGNERARACAEKASQPEPPPPPVVAPTSPPPATSDCPMP